MSQPEDFTEHDRGLEIHIRLFWDAHRGRFIAHSNVWKRDAGRHGETLGVRTFGPAEFERRDEARVAAADAAKAAINRGIDWAAADPALED